jgi:chemotaxis protein histidine kinase CheA
MSENKKFAKIQKKTHTEQAIWFLNGFWADHEKDTEEVWDLTHKMIEIQTGHPKLYGSRQSKQKEGEEEIKEGCDVDQFQAHRFLEHFGETKTASALRRELATIDVDKNNRLSLTEYLMFKFGKTITQIVNAPQGGSSEELRAAEEKLAEVQTQLQELSVKLEEEKSRAAEAKVQEEAAAKAHEHAVTEQKSADAALAEQKEADAKVRAAEAAVAAAQEELHKQEAEYKRKIEVAQAKANDPNLSTVKRSTAANKLAQLQAEDPLELNRAKITTAAALKKAQKQTKAAAKATAKSEKALAAATQAADEAKAAHTAAEEATAAAAAAAEQVAAAVEETENAMQAAQDAFEALKQTGGAPNGKIFWAEREMAEIKKFMPSGRKVRRR